MEVAFHSPVVISERAQRRLLETYFRVKIPNSASRLWDARLTPAERTRLGDDLAVAYRRHSGTIGMWMFLRGVSHDRSVIELGKELGFLTDEDRDWLLREVGESESNVEERIQRAVAGGGLVLVASPETAYWQQKEIDIDWSRCQALWKFLWELAVHSKKGQFIDRLTFGEVRKVAYVAKTKSRLTSYSTFPVQLADKMKSIGRGTMRLSLTANQIHLFQMESIDVLREVL